MQAGDLILVRANAGAVDRAIADVTGAPYTHAALAIGPAELVEAVWPKVRRGPQRYDALIVTPPYPDDRARALAVWAAEALLGTRYDLLGLADVAAYDRFPRARRLLARLRRDTGAPYVCSALVAHCLAAGGLPPAQPAHLTSPADLYRQFGPPGAR